MLRNCLIALTVLMLTLHLYAEEQDIVRTVFEVEKGVTVDESWEKNFFQKLIEEEPLEVPDADSDDPQDEDVPPAKKPEKRIYKTRVKRAKKRKHIKKPEIVRDKKKPAELIPESEPPLIFENEMEVPLEEDAEYENSAKEAGFINRVPDRDKMEKGEVETVKKRRRENIDEQKGAESPEEKKEEVKEKQKSRMKKQKHRKRREGMRNRKIN